MQYAEAILAEKSITVKTFAAMAGMLDSEVNMAGVDTLLITKQEKRYGGLLAPDTAFFKEVMGMKRSMRWGSAIFLPGKAAVCLCAPIDWAEICRATPQGGHSLGDRSRSVFACRRFGVDRQRKSECSSPGFIVLHRDGSTMCGDDGLAQR